jgi:hypothetical protein
LSSVPRKIHPIHLPARTPALGDADSAAERLIIRGGGPAAGKLAQLTLVTAGGGRPLRFSGISPLEAALLDTL